jgi:methionine-S-sulfoxide reductase
MRKIGVITFIVGVIIGGLDCTASKEENLAMEGKKAEKTFETSMIESGLERATFAGGCFWCMETPFEKMEGVKEVISGYMGGSKENPTYKEVSSGGTGHLEAIQIIYDPAKISYAELLDIFWQQIDPTDPGGQFVDRGAQYRSAIFYQNDEQKGLAEKSKDALEKSGRYDKPLVTPIINASTFYRAEEYHQDYYEKNPLRYKFYRFNSGRDQYLKKVWGDDEKKSSRTTEPAGDNVQPGVKDDAHSNIGKTFPEVIAESLAKTRESIPESAKGKVALVTVAFLRGSQSQLDTWLEPFIERFGNREGFTFYEVPMISSGYRFMRFIIDSGMRAGIPDKKHKHVVTMYGDVKKYLTTLHLDAKYGHAFLLDREGIIRWQGRGFATPEALNELFEIAENLA